MSMFRWLRDRSTRTGRSGQKPSRGCRPQLEVLEDRCLLSGGVLDTTFGSGSGVLDSSLAAFTRAFAVATYPKEGTANDGKIVVGGLYEGQGRSLKTQFAVVRYNLDGSLDKSFGGSGEIAGPTSYGGAQDVLVQPDGKVLAAGESNGDFAIVRYNADGSLDKTFGTRGVALTNIASNSFDRIYAIALDKDNNIVAVGGTTPPNSSTREVALVRYTHNGTLDTTFGKGGLALDHIPTSPLEGGGTQHFSLAIDDTGRIIVEAASPTENPHGGYDAMVIRYTSTGALAGYETFDGTALPSLTFTGGLAVQPGDDRIVVVGQADNLGQPVQGLVRLNSDGTPDGSLVFTNIRDVGDVDVVRLQPDGRIVVGELGNVTSGTGNTFTVARYNSDLSADTTFGTGGVAGVPNFATFTLDFTDMAFEPDGRIVVTGWSTSVNGHVLLARFLSTVPQITSCSASPNPAAPGSSVTLTASNIIDPTPSASITQVAFYLDSNNDGILEPATDTLLGYATQTSPGVWTYTFPVTQASGSYTLFAQAVDSYGVIGDPLALTLQVL